MSESSGPPEPGPAGPAWWQPAGSQPWKSSSSSSSSNNNHNTYHNHHHHHNNNSHHHNNNNHNHHHHHHHQQASSAAAGVVRNSEHGKNVSVTTINVPPPSLHEMHDAAVAAGKSVCKYLGGQNGVTVSVVSSCSSSSSPSSLGTGNATSNGGTAASSSSIVSSAAAATGSLITSSGSGMPSSAALTPGCLGGGLDSSESASVDDPEGDSDGEVSRIDFRGVNLRTKRRTTEASDELQQQPERPMSWEGELSDQEMSSNTLTGQDDEEHEETSMEGVQVCGSSPGPQDSPKFPVIKQEQPDFRSSPSLQSLSGNGSLNETIVAVPHVQQQQQQQLHHQQQSRQQQQTAEQSQQQQQQQSDLPLLVDKLLGGCNSSTPNHSPVLIPRHHLTKHSHTRSQVPSPDSAIHSAYSVFSSPTQSPHAGRHSALGPGSPVPSSSLSLSRHSFNNSSSSLSLSLSHSLSRNNSDASSSCYSYGSLSPPSHSPVQQRHAHHLQQQALHLASNPPGHHYGAASVAAAAAVVAGVAAEPGESHLDDQDDCGRLPPTPSGISTRQQLINSPCPICGDKISGFHYGIFSCESCKGFFKRTVQNRKNYVCLRGAGCPVTVATRKKCPACRFDKCLNMGMKLEAIREDRTRGGRSTYQCTYTLPAGLMGSGSMAGAGLGPDKLAQPGPCSPAAPGSEHHHSTKHHSSHSHKVQLVPQLLQDIMDVEHLWHYNDNDRLGASQAMGSLNLAQTLPGMTVSGGNSSESLNASNGLGSSASSTSSRGEPTRPASSNSSTPTLSHEQQPPQSQPQQHSSGGSSSQPSNSTGNCNPTQHPDFLSNLCNIADHRLYKIVKWCKSLPLFKNISIDDQICLLINSWCELLLFSCCFRSMSTPGEIRVSLGKSITLEQARQLGLATCIERMLAFTNNLRRLRVDQYEYVAMKVIVLLTSDTSELKEPEKVRASQEKALQALQQYTIARYPEMPAKFGELLLRIPDLQRTCQAGKELLSAKRAEGEGCSFNLLMELLRGDH